MMNKKGYLPRDFAIAGIFLMGIIAIMILMVQGFADNYNRGDLVDESFSEKYDRFGNLTGPYGTLLETTKSGSGLSFKGVFDNTFTAAFTAIQIVFAIPILFSNVFSNILFDFGVPLAVGNILFIMVMTSITIILVFAWLSSVSRGKI